MDAGPSCVSKAMAGLPSDHISRMSSRDPGPKAAMTASVFPDLKPSLSSYWRAAWTVSCVTSRTAAVI
eukprot:8370481-Alexandrium_andersonii.AAC.1